MVSSVAWVTWVASVAPACSQRTLGSSSWGRVTARAAPNARTAAAIPAAVEFFVALLFDKACGAPLWDYSYKRFSLLGYVCPSQTILWGLLITLAMQFIWDPLRCALQKIPPRAAKTAAAAIVFLLLADLAFNILWLCFTGAPLILY